MVALFYLRVVSGGFFFPPVEWVFLNRFFFSFGVKGGEREGVPFFRFPLSVPQGGRGLYIGPPSFFFPLVWSGGPSPFFFPAGSAAKAAPGPFFSPLPFRRGRNLNDHRPVYLSLPGFFFGNRAGTAGSLPFKVRRRRGRGGEGYDLFSPPFFFFSPPPQNGKGRGYYAFGEGSLGTEGFLFFAGAPVSTNFLFFSFPRSRKGYLFPFFSLFRTGVKLLFPPLFCFPQSGRGVPAADGAKRRPTGFKGGLSCVSFPPPFPKELPLTLSPTPLLSSAHLARPKERGGGREGEDASLLRRKRGRKGEEKNGVFFSPSARSKRKRRMENL